MKALLLTLLLSAFGAEARADPKSHGRPRGEA
jgi:hypothetical protein